jgi:hypothetical protein
MGETRTRDGQSLCFATYNIANVNLKHREPAKDLAFNQ